MSFYFDRSLPASQVVWVCLLSAVIGCAGGKVLWKPTKTVEPSKADTDAPKDFSSTPSGLKYKILRKSEGRSPKPSDRVKVHYKGWLDNGKVFDSSYDRGQPATFGVGQVIPGWTEGLQLMNEGGMIELEIPSELGYGRQGAGNDIPPNSTLHFQVELIKVL